MEDRSMEQTALSLFLVMGIIALFGSDGSIPSSPLLMAWHNAGSLSLQWTAPFDQLCEKDICFYDLMQCTPDGECKSVTKKPVAIKSAVIEVTQRVSGLAPGESYVFKVRHSSGVDSDGKHNWTPFSSESFIESASSIVVKSGTQISNSVSTKVGNRIGVAGFISKYVIVLLGCFPFVYYIFRIFNAGAWILLFLSLRRLWLHYLTITVVVLIASSSESPSPQTLSSLYVILEMVLLVFGALIVGLVTATMGQWFWYYSNRTSWPLLQDPHSVFVSIMLFSGFLFHFFRVDLGDNSSWAMFYTTWLISMWAATMTVKHALTFNKIRV